MKTHKMWTNYPTLAKDLESIIHLMENSIHLTNKEVEKAIFQMIHSGGKLLRPAYLLLFSEFGEEQNHDKVLALAASIEMLHTATLIHDDVVDDADTRRGLPTIQHQFNKNVAVYAGDYLFISCFKLLANYTSSLKSIQINADSMEKILTGELGQMNMRYNIHGTIDDYLTNISGKTAELFAASCFVGVYESGGSNTLSKKAKEIGENIGLAFQMIDDILDYTQTSQVFGKPVLEDVKQGIYSLPLLYALQEKEKELLPYLTKKENMSDEDAQAVFNLVHTSQGILKAKKLAESYTNKALKDIQKLPNNQQNTKDTLFKITQHILERSY